MGRLIAVLACLASLQAWARPSTDKLLDQLQSSVLQLRPEEPSSAMTSLAAPGSSVGEILRWLKLPRITASRYEEIARRWPVVEKRQSSLVKGEVAARLARHAYLHGRSAECLQWLSRIPVVPETELWQARSAYLKGLLSLESKKLEEARIAFQGAVRLGGAYPVAGAANLALARMALDGGKFDESEAFLMKVPESSAFYENCLEEGAWVETRKGNPDLAATNIDILFALYPESRRLPEAGFLYGRLMERSEDLEGGVRHLTDLVVRFEFEEQATEKALEKYAGREEELFAEFISDSGFYSARSILPPIGRTILGSNPLLKSYVAEIVELREEERDLGRERTLLSTLSPYLERPNTMTIEGVTLLERANSIERAKLGYGYLPPESNQAYSALRKRIADLSYDMDGALERLSEVDKHISIHWSTLRGDREKLALEIRQKARAEASLLHEQRVALNRASLKLDFEELRYRQRALTLEREALLKLRGSKRASDPQFNRLDRLRKEIEAKERARVALWLSRLPTMKRDSETTSSRLTRVRTLLFSNARSDLRSILLRNRDNLRRILEKYRFALAEKRYRLFRHGEATWVEIQRAAANEMERFERNVADIRSPGLPMTAPSLKTMGGFSKERSLEVNRFSEAARRYTEEIHRRIDARILEKRKRYENFARHAGLSALEKRERLREETLHEYRDMVRQHSGGTRTPHALFRIAQLEMERAETLRRGTDGTDLVTDGVHRSYAAAVAALDQIRREYPGFSQRETALYLLGHALTSSGKSKESAEAFLQLTAEYPKSSLVAEAELRVGEALFASKDYARSIPHYQAVLNRGFGSFYDKALYKEAWANYLIGRYDMAIARFLALLDYSGDSTAEQRERFTEFSSEASEYVAFSMHRSGGAAAAERVFAKIGWKPYGLSILMKLAEISKERGFQKEALSSYDLALAHYPVTAELPTIREQRVELFDQLGRDEESQAEKEQIVAFFSSNEGERWRKMQTEDDAPLKKADRLLERTLYSLASHMEFRRQSSRAYPLYEEVARRFPESRSAYGARFRMAELDFSRKNYLEAVRRYDEVVRSGEYGHHFNDALYGIVLARQELVGKNAVPEDSLAFQRAVDNFSRRAPQDPRIVGARYQAALLARRAGQNANARVRFLDVAMAYPGTSWGSTAYEGALDTHVADQEWDAAALLAAKILDEVPGLPQENRNRIVVLRENASFQAAANKTNPKEALQAYVTFQERYPRSPLASKALFNAFVTAKGLGDSTSARSALKRLIDTYGETPEGRRGNLELALLLDSSFRFDEAILSYRGVIAPGVDAKQIQTASLNLAELLSSAPLEHPHVKELEDLSRKTDLDPETRARIAFLAAKRANGEGLPSDALRLWRALALNASASAPVRAEALAQSARLLWIAGDAAAVGAENSATQSVRRLADGERDSVLVALAAAKAEKIERKRAQLTRMKIDSRSFKEFAFTFKVKARRLSELEKETVDLLELRSARGSAKALKALGDAYIDFTKELEALSPPKDSEETGAESFVKARQELIDPLRTKAHQAYRAAYDLLARDRILDPALTTIAERLGTEVAPPSKEPLRWIEPSLPEPPTLFSPLEPSAIWSRMERSKALLRLSESLALRPAAAEDLHDLAILRLYHGEMDEARRLLAQLDGKLPTLVRARLGATEALLANETKRALDLLNTVLLQSPSDHWAIRQKTLALTRLNRPAEALHWATESLERDPSSEAAHRSMGYALIRSGDTRRAGVAFERARAMAKGSASIDGELALTLTSPEDSGKRSALLSLSAKTGVPESAANWAILGYNLGSASIACEEWSQVEASLPSSRSFVAPLLKRCPREDKESP